jgi:hypothetical protein
MIGRTLVFRRVGNETLVSSAPSTGRATSPEQQQHRNRFLQATRYGKAQMASPMMKKAYALSVRHRNMVTAYNAAVSDYLMPPKITEVDLAQYAGHLSDTIRIKAVDDFRVVSVTVNIADASGTLIESGNAVMEVNGLVWVYTATVSNVSFAGDKVTIKAKDVPGNETVQEATM